MRNETEKIVLAGLFIAIGTILPSIFHAAGLGQTISPMHFPVLISGLILGWKYGLAVGLITPLLTSVMFSMPPLYPVAIGMSIEIGTYGLIIGLVYENIKLFKNNIFNIYFALIIAMIVGRLVYGLFMATQTNIANTEYGFKVFINSVVILTLPGIILQILTVPAIANLIIKRKNFNYR